MNQEQVKGNWHQIKGQFKAKWGKITDNDLAAAEGKAEYLAGKVQELYGQTKEEALKDVNEFFRDVKDVEDSNKKNH
jgi:uncharacterized protein YjbJ (UPF0337 family)